MLHDQRFVICGLSRLAVRVVRALTASHADVVVQRRQGEGDALLRLLPPEARVVTSSTETDLEALRAAGIVDAKCLLALSDDDLDNLRIAVMAHEAAPQIPVVLRAFDPTLADQLEQGLNIRRAYSVSALAAPAFIAAACGDEVLETLRLGESEVPLCRLTVRVGSLLAGKTLTQIEARLSCSLIAYLSAREWKPLGAEMGETTLAPGEEILIGGPLSHVLYAVCLNAEWLSGNTTSGRLPFSTRLRSHLQPIFSKPGGFAARGKAGSRSTRLPAVAVALVTLIALSVAVFAHSLHLSLVDAVYFVITTATTTGYGDINLKDSPDWLKLFGCLVMLSGGALLGILFSNLAAIATAERLEETMGRRAGRMRGHIVLTGLGNLGYRITRLLTDLGMDVVALELKPDSRFSDAVRLRAPVLTGDARLIENLERASMKHAVALIACTDDDMANIQASLHARRLNPNAATVARIFDDTLADRLTDAFTIDRALSASHSAVSAFVGAAMDERALRMLQVGTLSLIACRYTVKSALTAETLAAWRLRGIRILAFRTPTGETLSSPFQLPALLADNTDLILCGPAAAVREVAALS